MNKLQNKLVVISGCSGAGKSTLISELKNSDYSVISEIGREVVKEQLEINGNMTPWQNPKAFCEIAIERSIIAYKYDNLIHDLRFYPTVLMTPPWKEIFSKDDERKHSFEDAVKEYERLLVFYIQYGYRIIEISKVSAKERSEFVISNLR
jgi:predicted ATPase